MFIHMKRGVHATVRGGEGGGGMVGCRGKRAEGKVMQTIGSC